MTGVVTVGGKVYALGGESGTLLSSLASSSDRIDLSLDAPTRREATGTLPAFESDHRSRGLEASEEEAEGRGRSRRGFSLGRIRWRSGLLVVPPPPALLRSSRGMLSASSSVVSSRDRAAMLGLDACESAGPRYSMMRASRIVTG